MPCLDTQHTRGLRQNTNKWQRISSTSLQALTQLPLSLEEIKDATLQDATLQTVAKLISTGRWHAIKELADSEAHSEDLINFHNVKDDLCVKDEHNIILKGTQLVIQAKLRKRVVQLAHEGHQGITKTKAFIRSQVWFPGMDKAVEREVESCIPCQVNTNRSFKERINMSELPKGPWLDLSLDFCGPLPSGEYILVIVDGYSRYPLLKLSAAPQLTASFRLLTRSWPCLAIRK